MAYNINKSNGDPIVIADGSVDYAQFSIGLIGKNHQGYGDEMATNFIHMLEHFANSAAPANPTAGQIWYDTTGAGALNVYDGVQWNTILVGNNITGDIIPDTDLAYTIGDATHQFTDVWAQTFHGTATQSRYADLAERYEADEAMEPGTVVILGGAKEIKKSQSAGQPEVFGVVSTAPGLMLNSDAGTDSTHPYVALSGRVPVKVYGPCKKGDRLQASDHDGIAEVAPADADFKSIIGRALEDKEEHDIKAIEAVVGVK
jgi:hypothetical protein